VSRYQKGKTNLDFTEARNSEWQWQQLGHMQVCTSLQTDNHTSTPPLSFLQAGCPSSCPTNSIKALKAMALNKPSICNENEKKMLCKDYLLISLAAAAALFLLHPRQWDDGAEIQTRPERPTTAQQKHRTHLSHQSSTQAGTSSPGPRFIQNKFVIQMWKTDSNRVAPICN